MGISCRGTCLSVCPLRGPPRLRLVRRVAYYWFRPTRDREKLSVLSRSMFGGRRSVGRSALATVARPLSRRRRRIYATRRHRAKAAAPPTCSKTRPSWKPLWVERRQMVFTTIRHARGRRPPRLGGRRRSSTASAFVIGAERREGRDAAEEHCAKSEVTAAARPTVHKNLRDANLRPDRAPPLRRPAGVRPPPSPYSYATKKPFSFFVARRRRRRAVR